MVAMYIMSLRFEASTTIQIHIANLLVGYIKSTATYKTINAFLSYQTAMKGHMQ